MGKCLLCLNEKPLLKKSHIIPDFFYREAGLYNEKHQIITINVEAFAKSKRVGYVPTGDYEGGILCAECDNELIGELETYGRKVLYGGLNPTEQIQCIPVINPNDGMKSTICKNVDYQKFKLFLLSILFRASISKRDLFHEASISENELEAIRLILVNGAVGLSDNFPIIMFSYLEDETIPNDLISPALKSTPPGKTLITFLIGGFVFTFYITEKCKYINELEPMAIAPNRDLIIPHFPKGAAMQFIMQQIFGKQKRD